MKEQETLLEAFRSLDPVDPSDLVGLWRGAGIPSGHPFDGVLENLDWFGKRFTADRGADALLFRSGNRRLVAIDPAWIPVRLGLLCHPLGRTRVARSLFSWLRPCLLAKGPVASVTISVFCGAESAAMVYDDQPIVDHFRRIDIDSLMGAMTITGDQRIYFFELRRVEETSERGDPSSSIANE